MRNRGDAKSQPGLGRSRSSRSLWMWWGSMWIGLCLAIYALVCGPDIAEEVRLSESQRVLGLEVGNASAAEAHAYPSSDARCVIRFRDDETAKSVTSGSISYRWILQADQTARHKTAFAEGEIRLTVPSGAVKLWLDAWADGMATTTAMFDLAPKGEVELEVQLCRVASVRVEVVDAKAGSPLPGVAVRIERALASDAQGSGVMQADVAITTDADGVAMSNVAVGGYRVTCEGDDIDTALLPLTVKAGAPNVVRFQVERWTPVLRGVVVEAWSSRPVEGATVRDGGVQALTDSHGRFVLPLGMRHFSQSPFGSLEVTPPRGRSDLQGEVVTIPWHTQEVTLSLGCRALEVQIVDEEGELRESYDLHWHDMNKVPTSQPDWQPAERQGTGRFVLPKAVVEHRSCLLRLSQLGTKHRYAASRELAIRDEEGARVLVWKVPAAVAFDVKIVAQSDSSPIVGATVEALSLAIGDVASARTSVATVDYDAARAFPFSNNLSQLLASATSSLDGEARLVLSLPPSCFLRVSHGEFATEIIKWDEGRHPVTIRLKHRLTGCLTGVLRGRDEGVLMFVPAEAGIGGSAERVTASARLKGGQFHVEDCALGAYDVYLVEGGRKGGMLQFDYKPLGRMEALPKPGMQAALIMPDAANAKVVVRSESLRLGDELLFVGKGGSVFTVAEVGPKGGGETRLPPGLYTMARLRPYRYRSTLTEASASLQIQPGDSVVKVQAEFFEQPGRIRLMNGNEPVRSAAFNIDGFGMYGWSLWATDEDGWIDFKSVPGRSFVLAPSSGPQDAPSPYEGKIWRIEGPCVGQSVISTER